MLEEVADSLSLRLNRASRSLLNQDVTVLAMLEGKEHQVHSLLQTHDETRHLRFSQGDGVALANLVNPQRNHATTRAHHITITCATDFRVTTQTALRNSNLLLDSLRDAHRIDGISSLVRRETNHALHTSINGSIQRVVRTNHIRLHSLHREELATRHLLQRSSMEHIVHTLHGIVQRTLVAHIADVELNLVCHLRHAGLEVMTHIILLLLITTEDTNLTDVSTQEAVQHSITKTTRASSNQEDFVFEYTHFLINI